MRSRVIYVAIARDQNTLLCDYSPYPGNYQAFVYELLKVLLPGIRETCLTNRFTFYAISDDEGFSFICMAEHKFSAHAAFRLLTDTKRQFQTDFPLNIRLTGLEHSFQRVFLPSLSHQIELYNHLDAKSAQEIEREANTSTQIMSRNVDDIVGDNIVVHIDAANNSPQPSADEEMIKGSQCQPCEHWSKQQYLIVILLVFLCLMTAYLIAVYFCNFNMRQCIGQNDV